jgi:3-deoxy-manno-octulosonate cytidylyltransferase (CMP-KDO synthetase)
MNVIAVLPARMGATRFPGKPLAKLHGMPMIGHCYLRTRMAPGLTATYVATCDEVIADYVQSIGGAVVMTADTHNRATDRTAEALEKIEAETGETIDVVIMIQGDEPLIQPHDVEAMIRHFDDPKVEIVNIMAHIRDDETFRDVNNVKVAVDRNMDALYMSREAIPSAWKGGAGASRYMQIGAIAFRRDVLLKFNATPESPLEQAESVDMNRVLEAGGSIRMVPTDAIMLGVDTEGELHTAEDLLAKDPLLASYLQ